MAEYNLEIYIPYMGCPCTSPGGQQDRETEDFQKSLLDLKARYRDRVSYMFYALNLHLGQFKTRPLLSRILQEQGKNGLPVIFINDQPAFQGRFPGLNELENYLSNLDRTGE